ncbi:ABC transporter permease [Ktedonosporobacter rubrisoli]|uniref:Transport permease protein n=1 Tax=Ktedonosporobacter rubrisoli TaxID=2509675 RepID=A0A4P6JKL4_KTERU|nr:ABC transporter permease [Ktedonosporobacter rubrisoli]QBD75718.1 ABC transporter permease [Ktedonosporobacter rubrisoli]
MAKQSEQSSLQMMASLSPTTHVRSRFQLVVLAFLAMLRRDLLVTARQIVGVLIQELMQSIFFLFIFGRILPNINMTQAYFVTLFLPGIIGLTTMLSAIQAIAFPLILDFGFNREIDDRLLAPLPISLVAVEKVLFAAIRGLFAGSVMFLLAYLILGNAFQVRNDLIVAIIAFMILAALTGACLGLTIGASLQPDQMGLIFSLLIVPIIFTGCTYYPWTSLSSVRWFQIITLFNPLTYASEGLRYAMIRPDRTQTLAFLPPLSPLWDIAGLSIFLICFLLIGLSLFRRRALD